MLRYSKSRISTVQNNSAQMGYGTGGVGWVGVGLGIRLNLRIAQLRLSRSIILKSVCVDNLSHYQSLVKGLSD